MSFGVMFSKKIFSALLILSLITVGCAKKATNSDVTAVEEGDSALPVDDGSFSSASNLPGNLFDPNTASDGTPVSTSTSTTATSVSSQQQFCSATDTGLFGLNASQWGGASSFPWYGGSTGYGTSTSTSLNSCYSSGNGLGINSFLGSGLGGLNLMDMCLQQVLAAKPTSTDQAQVKAAFALASMAILRCGIQYLRMQEMTASWYAPQKDVYKKHKNRLLIYLKDQGVIVTGGGH